MNSTNVTLNSENEVASSILVGMSFICFYGIGLYLHIRIIIASKKEKDLTWKIDVTNSILMIVLFGHIILIHSLTYSVQDLSMYSGDWSCYTSKVVIHYTLLYNGGHSMIISMMKYLIIVHDSKFRMYKEHLKTAFFWINILHPILFIAVHLILVPDFYVVYGGFASINRCLGKSNYNKTKWWSLCDFSVPIENTTTSNAIAFMKEYICKGQVIFIYVIAYNLMDILFYCKTFSYMRR